MQDLNRKLNKIKTDYRKIFLNFAQYVECEIEKLKPVNLNGEIFDKFANGTIGWNWQNKVLEFLSKEENIIKSETVKIEEYRLSSNCAGCGVCCRFAVSEFSPEELHNKAENGDNYAKQFTSVFVPYENEKEVANIFPQYLDLLKNNNQSNYYIYHCPKVTQDNRCSDYENRPQICRDFPENPIGFLPPVCGFNEWKNKTEQLTLNINAKIIIIEFYKSKIKDVH